MASELLIARRYAKALFEVVGPSALTDALGIVSELRNAWESSSELREAFANPAIPERSKEEIISDLAEKIATGNVQMKNFFLLLQEKGRLGLLSDIEAELQLLVERLEKILSLKIRTSREVQGDEQSQLLERLKAEYGSKVNIEWEVDPSILGGMQIESGDALLDSSVRGSLEKIRSSLLM